MSRIDDMGLHPDTFKDDTFPEHLHSWDVRADGQSISAEFFFIGGKQFVPTWTTPDEARALAAALVAAALEAEAAVR